MERAGPNVKKLSQPGVKLVEDALAQVLGSPCNERGIPPVAALATECERRQMRLIV